MSRELDFARSHGVAIEFRRLPDWAARAEMALEERRAAAEIDETASGTSLRA